MRRSYSVRSTASPRLWRTSHRIDDFAETIYDTHDLGQLAGKIGDDLNRFVNKTVGSAKKTITTTWDGVTGGGDD